VARWVLHFSRCKNTRRERTESEPADCSRFPQVPVAFFFEGAPTFHPQDDTTSEAPSPTYVSDFLATSDGLALTKAFMDIKQPKLRRRIVDLVEEIAGRED
jgi:hypothetical protein